MNYLKTMNDRAYEIHEWAKKQGFWDNARLTYRDPVTGDVECRLTNPSLIPEKLALIHTEVSEAMEAHRDGNVDGKHGIAEELADTIIRVLDLAAYLEINIDQEVANKQVANSSRPHMHGRKC